MAKDAGVAALGTTMRSVPSPEPRAVEAPKVEVEAPRAMPPSAKAAAKSEASDAAAKASDRTAIPPSAPGKSKSAADVEDRAAITPVRRRPGEPDSDRNAAVPTKPSRAVPLTIGMLAAAATILLLNYALRDPGHPTVSGSATTSASASTTAATTTSATSAAIATTAASTTSEVPGTSASASTDSAPSSSSAPSTEPEATGSASSSVSGDTVAPEDDEKKPLSWRVIQALNHGKTARAYDLAVQYTSAAPNNPKSWQMRGGVELQLGKNAKASFRRCADLAPPDSELARECKALSE